MLLHHFYVDDCQTNTLKHKLENRVLFSEIAAFLMRLFGGPAAAAIPGATVILSKANAVRLEDVNQGQGIIVSNTLPEIDPPLLPGGESGISA